MAAVLKAGGLGGATGGAGNDVAMRKAEDLIRNLENEARESKEKRAAETERARRADERAKRAEEELESFRQQLRRKEQDDIDTARRLQAQQSEDRSMLESLRGELRQEREARLRSAVPPQPPAPAPQAIGSAAAPSELMLQSVLKVAESALKVADNAQQAVLQLREESKSETCVVAERMSALEDRLEQRLEAWESSLGRHKGDGMKALSAGTGSRIAHFQGLHQRQTGQRMFGGQENSMIGAMEPNRGGDKGAPVPLLRRNF